MFYLYIYRYAMEYSLAIKKKGIMSFAETRMDLENRKRKTNTVWCYLYVESKQTKLTEIEDWWLSVAGGWEEILVKDYKLPVIR